MNPLIALSAPLACLGGTWLVIPWLWIHTRGDPAYVTYAVVVNVIMALAVVPGIRGMIDRKRRAISSSFEGGMDAMPMGRGLKKMGNGFGLKDEP
jgi:hypothetical protein